MEIKISKLSKEQAAIKDAVEEGFIVGKLTRLIKEMSPEDRRILYARLIGPTAEELVEEVKNG